MDVQFTPSFELRVGVIEPMSEDRRHNTWHTVHFDPPFSQKEKVVVIPMTQTYNGPEIPGLRLRNVNHASFELRFDEANILKEGGKYASDGDHVNETVGWVAYGFKP